MKLRNRLLLLNASVIGVTAVLMMAAVYLLVSYQMRKEMQGFLSDEFNEYALKYESMLDDIEEVSLEMQEHFTKARMAYPIICRIYDRSGKLVAVADNAGEGSPTDTQYIMRALKGEELRYELSPHGAGSSGSYRCTMRQLTSPKGEIFAFEVGLRADRLNRRIGRLRDYLLISIPAILLISTAGASLLASRSLRPFGEMLDNLHQIRSSSLDRRLPISNTEDELDRLSQAVNAMLEDVHNAFLLTKEFTSDAAHELRTPLARLTVMLERSLSKSPSLDEARVILDDAYQDCMRLRRLIDDLMLLARLDAGQVPQESKTLDIADIVDDMEELWAAACQERRINIRLHVNRPLPICGRAILLHRLLTNLVDNAMRFTPAEGFIQVIAGQANGSIEIKVKDSGAGIGQEDISKLFNRFYRSDSNRSSETGGTGLGLSICLKIAELHGGTISVESVKGTGSTFTVKLPLLGDSI